MAEIELTAAEYADRLREHYNLGLTRGRVEGVSQASTALLGMWKDYDGAYARLDELTARTDQEWQAARGVLV